MNLVLSEGTAYGTGSISAQGQDGSTWSATFAFDLEDTSAVTVRLEPKPLEAGNGFVGILAKDATFLAEAEGGSLSYRLLGNGQVSGEATVIPNDSSATFEGRFVVQCVVYPESIGQMQNGQGDGTVHLLDEAFSSSFCQPFKSLTE
jgi:hypothetical protein